MRKKGVYLVLVSQREQTPLNLLKHKKPRLLLEDLNFTGGEMADFVYVS